MKNGCVASDTMVRMLDGSEKRIDVIEPIDNIVSKDNQRATIIDIFRGREERLQIVETEDGHTIRTTKNLCTKKLP